MSTEERERERDDWKAAANGWEERAERVTAERDEARATVERVSALLARWEDPDTMEIDIGDLRAALSPAGGSEKKGDLSSSITQVRQRLDWLITNGFGATHDTLRELRAALDTPTPGDTHE